MISGEDAALAKADVAACLILRLTGGDVHAIGHLQQADQILIAYEQRRVAGRCADLHDVRHELESIIPSPDQNVQVRGALHAWETTLERIRALAVPGSIAATGPAPSGATTAPQLAAPPRSEEHTSELQSQR